MKKNDIKQNKAKTNLCMTCVFLILFWATACTIQTVESASSNESSQSHIEDISMEGSSEAYTDESSTEQTNGSESSAEASFLSEVFFYSEYGLYMESGRIICTEHEKELLKRLGAAANMAIVAEVGQKIDNRSFTPELGVYFYDDFDGDGTFEMFATEASVVAGNLWFIDDNTAVKINSCIGTFAYYEPLLLEIQNSKFVVFRTFNGVSSTCDYMYGVRDGVPIETNTSSAMVEGTNRYGELLLIQTTYDATVAGPGRTWKPYYFYMKEFGVFVEYGGVEISLDDVYSLNGAKAILDEHLPKNAKITSIFHRSNGVVNINYIASDKAVEEIDMGNGYITLRYDGSETHFEQDGSGIYLSALFPEVAEYPNMSELKDIAKE